MAARVHTQSPSIGSSSPDLGTVLGHWSTGQGPLYLQLAEGIRTAIECNDLPAGTRFPPERVLARNLAVSRTTVIGAFDRLKAEGMLESRQGSGTWVARRTRSLDARVPEAEPMASFVIRHLLRTGSGQAPTVIDLATTAFREPPAIHDALVDLAHEPSRSASLIGYLPHGLPELRARVADVFTADGVPTTPSQVLITCGVQQAAMLIGSMLMPDGGSVLVENPTWTGLLDVLRALGSHLVPIPVDRDGARMDIVHEAIDRHRPRLVWLTPTFHNPTGTVMSHERRRAAARLAEDGQVCLVEDLALRSLSLSDQAGPPIAHYRPDHVISVGSLSKVFWPGLRVGWVRASEATIARLARLKSVWDNGGGLIDQLVAIRLLDGNDAQARLRTASARSSLTAWEAALSELLPAWTWTRPAGGLSLWVRLPHGSAFELSQVALRHAVEFVPGAIFSPNETLRSHLRLPLTVSAETIAEASNRLAEAWRTYEQHGHIETGPRSGVIG
jgi:DNA-binding transcriptional MocR family regulator